MRTIKFRGKRVNRGEWVYSTESFVHTDEGICMGLYNEEKDVIPDTVGQFTGLYDKYDKEIYEGDIVLNKEIGGYGIEYVGVVRYYEEDCRFGIDTTTTNKFTKRLLFTDGECSFNDGYCTIKYCNEYEVLGNIFDNPELLKSL